MDPGEYMRATFETYKYNRILLIAAPLPPVKVRGLIYMPDCFASKTFQAQYDQKDGLGKQYSYKVLGAVPSENGPAILISIELGNVIGFNAGILTVLRQSICASVSYWTRRGLRDSKGERADYAIDVSLDNLNFNSSCNPGSHVVVPMAPHLTALLQYATSPDDAGKCTIIKNLSYMAPERGMALFPEIDFGRNVVVDNYIATCAVDPRVRYGVECPGVQAWAAPCLLRLRLNRLQMVDAPKWGVLNEEPQLAVL